MIKPQIQETLTAAKEEEEEEEASKFRELLTEVIDKVFDQQQQQQPQPQKQQQGQQHQSTMRITVTSKIGKVGFDLGEL